MNGPTKHDAHVEVGVEGTFETTYTIIITRTAPAVKHISDDRTNEPTRIAAETYSRQEGAADWLCVAAVSLVLALRGVFV